MARALPLLAALLSCASALQPVLRFRDPKTRGEVVLVGCMHYNPASIALASSIMREEAAAKRLRACVVESCPTRWNTTLEMQPQGSLYRAIFDNEMQAAAEVAEEYGRPVELGDQAIEDTGRRIVQLFALTLVQLLTPAGWQAIYADLREGAGTLTCEDESVGVGALLDPQLIAALPVTLVRYPLAAVVKSPLLALPLALLLLPLITQDASSAASVEPVTLAELGSALAFAALETLVLGRVFLVALLEERNYALARNIRKAHFATRGGDTVVAVLGAAHLNGVKRLLTSSRVV